MIPDIRPQAIPNAMKACYLVLLCLSALVARVEAKASNPQDPAQTDRVPESLQLPSQAHGFGKLDGSVAAGGPGWSARLSDAGVEVVPHLDDSEGAPVSFSMRLVQVRRESGWSRSFAGDRTAPELVGQRASFARPTLVEWYETRAEGLKQNFTFATKPPGSGDLWVQLEISTALTAQPAFDWSTQLNYCRGDETVLVVRDVLGIDANGATQVGDMRAESGSLWLRLPEEFVDHAAYPMVLDPTIGPYASVSGLSQSSLTPAVGYHPSLDQFLVAWSVNISANQAELRAQRMTATGAPTGSLLILETGLSNTIATDPAVGFHLDRSRFVVAYRLGVSLFAPRGLTVRTVDSDGTVSASTVVANSSAQIGADLAVGSEAESDKGDGVLVAASAANGAQVKLWRITPTVAGPSVSQELAALPDQGPFGNDQPSLSKSGGIGGNHLLSWRTKGLLGDSVRTRVVGRNGGYPGNFLSLAPPSLSSASRPATDGFPTAASDGRWLVAAQVWEPGSTELHDIQAWSLRFDGTSLSLVAGPVFVRNVIFRDEMEPAVIWMGAKAYVAWSEWVAPLEYRVFAKGVNPLTCLTCESTFAVSWDGGIHRRPQLAGVLPQDGGKPQDRALAVWQHLTNSFLGGVYAQSLVLSAQSGTVVSLGGGCGGITGVNVVPAIGAGGIVATLTGADPTAALAVFNVAPLGLAAPIPCGTCVFEPYFLTFLRPAVGGSASVNLSIPCSPSLVGAQLVTQWSVYPTATVPCPIAPGFGFSDRSLWTLGL